MSTLNEVKNEEEVIAFLLEALCAEDANVVAAEEEVARRLAVVKGRKERVLALREALKALGIDPDDPQVRRNYE